MLNPRLHSKVLQKLNDRSSATRIVDGRIVPTNRFQLNPGSLRGATANVDAADRDHIRAIAPTGERFVMTQMKHPILKSIDLESHSGRLGAAAMTGGPLITAAGGMILRDRADTNVRWVRRAFVVDGAAQISTPVFRARKSGTAIDGTDLWTADLTLPVSLVRLAATDRQIDQMRSRDSSLRFQDIPMTLREATLKLPYDSAQGRRMMELQGHVGDDQSVVTFSLTGDAIALAWKHFRESDAAGLQLLSEYIAYEAVERPVPHDTPKPTAAAPKFNTALGNPRLASLFGGKIRRADISASRKINRPHAKPIVVSPSAMRANILRSRAALLAAANLGKATANAAANIVATAQPAVFAKQKMVNDISHTLDFRGEGNARLFVMVDPSTGRDIRIGRPPWASHGAAIRELEELDGVKLGLPASLATRVTVYASLVDVGLYIVVPDVYVMGREPDTGALQFHAEVISDPMIPENSSVRVTVGLEPEISPADEVILTAALERHLDQSAFHGGPPPAPKLRFPTDLGTLPQLAWGDPLSQAGQPIIDGRTVLLTLTTTKLGFAKAMFDTLAQRGKFLGGQLAFGMPDARLARVSLLVGLTRTTGPTLRADTGAGDVTLVDLSGFDQTVTALVRRSEYGTATPLDLSPHVTIAAGAGAVIRPSGLDGGGWVAHSDLSYPDRVDLDPTRINVDALVTSVIFTTALERGADFGGKSLQSLTVEAMLPGQAPLSVVMNADVDTGYFPPQIVNLALPLDQALSPSGRVLTYRITAMFGDGSRKITDWTDQNFGSNPDITIRRDALG